MSKLTSSAIQGCVSMSSRRPDAQRSISRSSSTIIQRIVPQRHTKYHVHMSREPLSSSITAPNAVDCSRRSCQRAFLLEALQSGAKTGRRDVAQHLDTSHLSGLFFRTTVLDKFIAILNHIITFIIPRCHCGVGISATPLSMSYLTGQSPTRRTPSLFESTLTIT